SVPESPVREFLVVQNHCADPWVRYEYSDDERSLGLEVMSYRQVQIRSEVRRGDATLAWELDQPASGPLRLVIEQASGRSELQAASIWHLLLGHRTECEATLLPALQLLRPGWRLAEMAARVESELFRAALAPPEVSRGVVESLILEL